MANGDPTGLNFAIAGDYDSANEWIEFGFPDRALDTIVAGALAPRKIGLSSSDTPLEISTGEKVLTVNESPRGYPAFYPLLLVSATSPYDHWMWGLTTQPEGEFGSLTIDIVTTGSGTGTKSDWSLVTLWLNTTIVNIPVSLADGGFGVSMNTSSGASTGRSNLEIPRTKYIRRFDETTPSTVDGIYSAGDFGHIAKSSTSGAFVGHEDELFRFNATGDYTFYPFSENNPGDYLITDGYSEPGDSRSRRFSDDSQSWVLDSPMIRRDLSATIEDLSSTDLESRSIIFIVGPAVEFIGLPAAASIPDDPPPLLIFRKTASLTGVTISVDGGGLIDDQTSVQLYYGGQTIALTIGNSKWISISHYFPGYVPLSNVYGAGTNSVSVSDIKGTTATAICSAGNATIDLDTAYSNTAAYFYIKRQDNIGGNTCTLTVPIGAPQSYFVSGGATSTSYLLQPLTMVRVYCDGGYYWIT